MKKRGFNASIIPLTKEEANLDLWHKDRSILFKRNIETLIKNFEKSKK